VRNFSAKFIAVRQAAVSAALSPAVEDGDQASSRSGDGEDLTRSLRPAGLAPHSPGRSIRMKK
jgi:hypothetical protein